MPLSRKREIASTALAKFRGPRISSLTSGSALSSETCTAASNAASGSSSARRRRLNSVPLLSTTTGSEPGLPGFAGQLGQALQWQQPSGDAWPRLGQAISARQVAVIVHVDPQPPSDG